MRWNGFLGAGHSFFLLSVALYSSIVFSIKIEASSCIQDVAFLAVRGRGMALIGDTRTSTLPALADNLTDTGSIYRLNN